MGAKVRNITKEIVSKWLKEKKHSDGKGKFPGEYPTRIWLRVPEKKFEYFGKPSMQEGLRLRRCVSTNVSQYSVVEFDRNGIVYSAIYKYPYRVERLVLLGVWVKYHPDVTHDTSFIWLRYDMYRKSFYRNGVYGKRKAGDGI